MDETRQSLECVDEIFGAPYNRIGFLEQDLDWMVVSYPSNNFNGLDVLESSVF